LFVRVFKPASVDGCRSLLPVALFWVSLFTLDYLFVLLKCLRLDSLSALCLATMLQIWGQMCLIWFFWEPNKSRRNNTNQISKSSQQCFKLALKCQILQWAQMCLILLRPITQVDTTRERSL